MKQVLIKGKWIYVMKVLWLVAALLFWWQTGKAYFIWPILGTTLGFTLTAWVKERQKHSPSKLFAPLSQDGSLIAIMFVVFFAVVVGLFLWQR